jgi:acetyl-CoA C-acetyltransferase/acetyl-CoA acyltransferase
MREVAVVGVGMTKFGASERTSVEMFAEAAMEAINESNIKPKDIEALFLGNVLGGFEEGQIGMSGYVAAEIGASGIPATRFEGICASSGVAIRDAFIWVASGFYDIVLAGGTEKACVMGTPYATRTFAMGADSRYEFPAGFTYPSVFGMMAYQYSRKYGVDIKKLKEQMALVAVKSHHNGTLNPKAHFQKEITVADVLNSPVIAEPLQLYDCCPFSDGGAAVVIASLDKAKKLTDKPVLLAGVGQGSAGSIQGQKDLTSFKARESAAKQAYTMAGIGPQDIGLCELHDCFTIHEITASETLGFFSPGTASAAVERGETKIGGGIPIGPSGGLKAKGHPIGATGAAQVYEIAKQLRDECGARQVEGAKVGLADTMGGDACIATVIILKRGW